MTRGPLLMLVLASCTIAAAPACRRVEYTDDDASKIHVGIVFDIGGKDDRSFNAAAWAGVKCAETGTLPTARRLRQAGARHRAARRRAGHPASTSSRRCAPLPSAATT